MKNKKFITLLLSAVLAVALWAYVITVEKPESENTFYNVPVVLDGQDVLTERGLMITSDTNLTVTLKLSGTRSELSKLKSSDIAALVDLSRIYEAGEKNVSYTESIPGNTNIEVVSRTPEKISLTIVEWASKEIPVELVYSGQVQDGYYVDKQNARVDDSAVTITGPKDIVNQIAMAKITVDLTGRTETIVESLRYALCDKDGNPIEDVSSVTTDTGEIRVTVIIQHVKEIDLTIDIIDGGGLTKDDVTISMDYHTITVAGSKAALIGLDRISLGTIDLGSLTESTQIVLPIKLPDGVTNQSGVTEVTVDVVLPELETRAYIATVFEAINVPEGLTAQINTKRLDVKLRGLSPVLDRITSADLVVVVDFAGAEPGMATYAAVIQIRGFEDVEGIGAVEKYTVTASLTKE